MHETRGELTQPQPELPEPLRAEALPSGALPPSVNVSLAHIRLSARLVGATWIGALGCPAMAEESVTSLDGTTHNLNDNAGLEVRHLHAQRAAVPPTEAVLDTLHVPPRSQAPTARGADHVRDLAAAEGLP